MVEFAKRMERLGTENAFVVLAEVNKLKAQGRHIINFGIGEPDFDTPSNIRDAAIKALNEGFTHYGPSAGLPQVKETIAKYVSKTRNIQVSPDEVVITPGAKPIIFYTIFALVNEGEEVIYPNPGFPIYESVINFVNAKPVPLPLLEEKKFSFDVEYLKKIVTSKTKLIILNSPQNPTGGVLARADLEAVAEIAVKNNIWVLSDEIYGRIIYEGKFESISSIAKMKERTIILDGFSKTYAMTGWRIGYGVMQKELAEQIARLETNNESCTASFTQIAAAQAYEGPQDETENMVAIFKKRRDLIVSGLNDIKGIHCLSPSGAFYVFPNVTQACKNLGFKDAKALQEHILYEGNTAVLPRTSFGMKNIGEKEEYIRLSYANSEENIIEGLGRIKKLLEK